MLNDLEVVFCLDDLLLHIVLLDHLLYKKDRKWVAISGEPIITGVNLTSLASSFLVTWDFSCLVSTKDLEKAFPQKRHLNGFSPVWFRMWSLRRWMCVRSFLK